MGDELQWDRGTEGFVEGAPVGLDGDDGAGVVSLPEPEANEWASAEGFRSAGVLGCWGGGGCGGGVALDVQAPGLQVRLGEEHGAGGAVGGHGGRRLCEPGVQ